STRWSCWRPAAGSATCSRPGCPTCPSSWTPSTGSPKARRAPTPGACRRGAAAPPARRRTAPLAVLSSREREVLALMAEGRSNAGIARRLWVTEGTVEKHVRSILTKLTLPEAEDDHRRVLAVLTFLEAR